jgi:general secretion pathway protein G
MKTLTKYSVFCALLSICAWLTGCSSSPSARDGERAIQDHIKNESEGRIKLVGFEKTNGQLGEIFGVKVYGMDFAADIEFLEDCKWVEASFQTSKLTPLPQNSLSQLFDTLQNPGKPVSKGQRTQLSGVVHFVKKENGWTVDTVEITRSTPINAPAGSRTARETAGQSEVGAVMPNPNRTSTSGSLMHQVLATMPPPPSRPQTQQGIDGRVKVAEIQMLTFKNALNAYQMDMGHYPSSQNGLLGLIQQPTDAVNWHGPYLGSGTVPKDPWGNDYWYECPGQHNSASYDLASAGPDGRLATEDDICNWTPGK